MPVGPAYKLNPALRPTAKGSRKAALLVNVPYLDAEEHFGLTAAPVNVTVYAKGARVHWPVTQAAKKGASSDSTRGQIRDMTLRSRLRAAFILGNAPHPWEWMVTLTFREQPKSPKACFDRWQRGFRRDWTTDCQWAWIMEYQRRGVAHYHVFLGADFVRRNAYLLSPTFERVVRRGCETSLVRGPFDSWCVAQWSRAVGDNSVEFASFQTGGIVEAFRTPDAAARYVAKEASKRHQKSLPEGVEGGRRWFWCSPACKATPVRRGRLTRWPFAKTLGMIFDQAQLAGCIQGD